MWKHLPISVVLLSGVMALPALAAEPESYPSGFSDTVVNMQRETVTDWLLQQQRQNAPAVESELPAQLYVDSQRRLGDSFRTPIPDSFGEQTREQSGR
ncbi:hypothetical protein S7S_00495 [Isoalcanivorax pacificus W11-5]|uniref:DUF3613 domain-containing protein n=1 Tax=Isoalcanivorax pacificus W11-5 TaxID=391936 RepID=A0A0B4XIY5_9GAMM|nr:hypothetical protein [Isoalcanivorax pacificus]AJD46523.1 hypothetical protein S7S_00495 [Isoalcanivorax pacificus W11-5]